MPFLNKKLVARDQNPSLNALSSGNSSAEPWLNRGEKNRTRLFETCANPGCSSGWLHLWRSRSVPIFEGGWSCSAACTATRLDAAIGRELDGRGSPQENHRHRIPLGLVMLEQGWITSGQLRQALDAQKGAGAGRLGHWLVHHQGISEQLVTRALGLQWSCPVLPLELHDAEALTVLVPRLFVDAFGADDWTARGERFGAWIAVPPRPHTHVERPVSRSRANRSQFGSCAGPCADKIDRESTAG